MLEFSPNLDARVCYLIVLCCALVSAYAQLYGRLQILKAKVIYAWSLFSTWMVFTIYLSIPLALFWFLDRAGAIHDSSAFAALLVGLVYPAVLSGGTSIKSVQGLGGVFDWLNKAADSLVTKTTLKVTLQGQLFERVVVDHLAVAANNTDYNLVEALALLYSDSPDQVKADLAAAAGNLKAKAQIVYDAATGSAQGLKPINNSLKKFASKPQIVSPYSRAKNWVTGYVVLLILLVALALILALTEAGRERFLLWRVAKPSVTASDFRHTSKALMKMLDAKDERSNCIRLRLVEALQEPMIESQQTDQILQLVLDSRGNTNDPAFKQTALLLTDALRFATVDVRVRLHHALLRIAEERSPRPWTDDRLTSLDKWTPIATESLIDLEAEWRAWQQWWDSQKTK